MLDRHMLYEAAVQNPSESTSTMRRIYKKKRGLYPHLMREDFCGTAAISCEWVRKNKRNRAWALDLDRETLDWARRHNVSLLSAEHASRVHLLEGDVLHATEPKVDVVNAFNFSYFVFKDRTILRNYFSAVHGSLLDHGMFIFDIFGGTESMTTNLEKRDIPATKRPDGQRIPRFKYIWQHEDFDVITHHILCHIHFEVPGEKKIREAFTYDWRLWTIPEVREVLAEAGFRTTEVYIHGWTEEGESDDIFRRRRKYENSEGWIAYVAAFK